MRCSELLQQIEQLIEARHLPVLITITEREVLVNPAMNLVLSKRGSNIILLYDLYFCLDRVL